ncbi:type I DNA topoisomerase [Clostridium sp. D2Q-11]|uniref:DNA topoisomerase 1 n=1 Tax=Anaeromonas frigoriresistens TaxID=2683708 RepID=A0A942UXD4_9FIRM|nr:type I DNA topoisomerase [Anaeromonas frigoriresistens]MBS4539835.1 type I DNA topoisomerase [Anaeromonas frigoriresistens]
MAKSLVIVESPAKAKTIGKFLGRKYKIKASVGHIIDLPKSKLGIDIEDNFEPRYITIRGKGPILSELKKEAKKADKVYLATDPDREGEAISWHLANALNLDKDDKNRIEFNEITKNAIINAMKKPRKIDMDLVDAQQARRVLDRLVGYKISPLLWKKVRKGLSAGRVQSVATKLIVDREREIEKFIPEEYWSIDFLLLKDKAEFESTLNGKMIDGKVKKIKISNEEESKEISEKISKSELIVKEVKRGKKRRNPYPSYTTSSLQQDASTRLGFSTKKTMRVAQDLYQGIDIKGAGTVGLITYIRTDSTRISNEAQQAAKEYISSNYGEKYLARNNKSKNKKNIQDAHEAIRPTDILRTPSSIKESLKNDQYKLYKLIWERFVASQMSQAVYDTLGINISAEDYVLRTSGSQINFDGFMKVYPIKSQDKNMDIPNMEVGDKLNLKDILPKQHFTQPPAKYSEASLVKAMEELGIGRPATYSPTISTILSRGYVLIENKYFKPTELGFVVTDLLIEYFENIINEEFTASMEDKLDKVEEGNIIWKKVIEDFYNDFEHVLKVAEEEITEIDMDEETDIECEKCGRNMVIKHGRYGKFLACPGYPECKNTKPILNKLDIPCPKCKDGEIIERRSKKGRKFYGCTNYPECDFVSWDMPINESCPDCGSILVKKNSKKGNYIKCSECDYKRNEKEEN